MNASDCKSFQGELSAYLDGELQDAERAACEAHLRECGNCRAMLEDLSQAARAVSALPRLQAPPALAARLRQEVLSQPAPRDFSKFDRAPVPLPATDYSMWRPVLFGAAALVMLLVMGILMLPALSVPKDFRYASVGESRPRAKVAPRTAIPRSGLPKVEITPAEAAPELAAPTAPATEAPGRAAGAIIELKPEGAVHEALAKDAEPKLKEAAPFAPAAPVAAAQPPPAPPAALPSSAAVYDKSAAKAALPMVAKRPAPNGAVDELAMKGRGMQREEEAASSQAPVRNGKALAERGQDARDVAVDDYKKDAGDKQKAASDLVGRFRKDGVSAPGDAANLTVARKRNLAADQDATLALIQQKAKNGFSAGEEKRLAQDVLPNGPAKSGGAGGGTSLGAKTAPTAEGALQKVAEAGANARNTNDFSFGQQQAEVAAAQPRPSTSATNVEVPTVRAKSAVEKAKGQGAEWEWIDPAAVLVFRTQDRDRLVSQLRELAAQNGARLEMAEALADRQPAARTQKKEARQSKLGADKDERAGRVDCEIVTMPGQQRRDILAKLRELQAVNFRGSEAELRRGTEQLRAPRESTLPAPELQPAAQQELRLAEAKQTDPQGAGVAGNRAQRQAAMPGAQTEQQSERPEARIQIRIELIPAQ